MSFVSPKLLIFAVVAVCILLIAQVGAFTANTVTSQRLPNLEKDFPFKSVDGLKVDPEICTKIQLLAKSKDPCFFKIDYAKSALKLFIGQKVVASAEYAKFRWAEIDQQVRDSVGRLVPQYYGKEVWSSFIEVNREFQQQGLGSYMLSTADSLLRSNMLRLVVDMEGWITRGKNIPVDSTILAHHVYMFATK